MERLGELRDILRIVVFVLSVFMIAAPKLCLNAADRESPSKIREIRIIGIVIAAVFTVRFVVSVFAGAALAMIM